MFSATKFVVAGAILALFGGVLLSGVLTQQPSDDTLPAVGASASATAQAEPSEAATSGPEPTTEAVADSTTPDLLPGVDLVTEEVEPGVYRVVSDGVRNLLSNVRGATVSAEGEVWVVRGKPGDWRVVRLGQAGASRRRSGQRPLELDLTRDGEVIVTAGRWRNVFDGDAWERVSSAPIPCGADFPSEHLLLVDGECWRNGIDRGRVWLRKVDPDDPTETRGRMVLGEDVGLPETHGVNWLAPVGDGTGWAAIDARTVPSTPRTFAGLAYYDGETWTHVPFDGIAVDDVPKVSRPASVLEVAPDGSIWVGFTTSERLGSRLTVVRWDGDGWAVFGPVPVEEAPWLSDSVFLPDGTVWFLDGQAMFDGEGVRSVDLPVRGELSASPDGTIWSVADGGLYVVTPEAVME